MKTIFSKLGFKKADEMEKSIATRSIRVAWIYTVLFLFVWSLYESFYKSYYLHEAINLLPGFLLVSQSLIMGFSQLYFRNRMVDGEDEEKQSSFEKIFVVIIITVTITTILGYLFVVLSR